MRCWSAGEFAYCRVKAVCIHQLSQLNDWKGDLHSRSSAVTESSRQRVVPKSGRQRAVAKSTASERSGNHWRGAQPARSSLNQLCKDFDVGADRFGLPGGSDDKRHSGAQLEVGEFMPRIVLTQLPPMIPAPPHTIKRPCVIKHQLKPN